MPIMMYNGDQLKCTFTCKECRQQFKLVFQCSRCFEPVCIGCGKLRPEESTQFFTLVDNVTQAKLIDPILEIGLNEWVERENGDREDFFCDPCHTILTSVL